MPHRQHRIIRYLDLLSNKAQWHHTHHPPTIPVIVFQNNIKSKCAPLISVSCLTLGKGLWLLALSLKQTDTTFSVSRTILRRMCFHKIMQAPPLEIAKLERTNRESSIHNIPEPLSLLLTSPQFLNRSLDSHLFHVGHVIIARLCLQQDPSSALTLELRQVKLSWKSPAASCPLPLLAQAVLSRPRHRSQRPQKASSAN